MEYPKITTKALKTPLPFPTFYLCEAGCPAMTATKMRLWRRLAKQHTLKATLSHHLQMGPSSYRRTSSGLPPILHYGELYNYFIIYHNVIIIELKCTINVMHLNYLETIPLQCLEKLFSTEAVMPERLGTSGLKFFLEKIKM